MIANARDIPLTAAHPGLPNMRTTITGWFQALSLGIVRKTTVNFQVKEVRLNIDTRGMIQPFTSRQLSIKPEGERAWQWNLLHVTADCVLCPDDQVTIQGKVYRVMGSFEWGEYGYGYNHYEVVKDYVRTR